MPKILLASLSLLFLTLFGATTFADSSSSLIQANICGNLAVPTLNVDQVATTDSINFDIPGSTGSANIQAVLYVNNQITDSTYSDNQGDFIFSEKLPLGDNKLLVKAYDSCGYMSSSTEYSYANNPKTTNINSKSNIISIGFITQHLFPPVFPQAHATKKDVHYYVNSVGGNIYDALVTIALWMTLVLLLSLLILWLKKKQNEQV